MPEFIGLKNYYNMFTDPEFWIALKNTFYYGVATTLISVTLALIFAFLIHMQIVRFSSFFKTSLITPYIISSVAIMILWAYIFDPTYGLVNAILEKIISNPPQWYADPKWAMPTIILYGVWSSVGYYTVLFLAGLAGIPQTFFEAAMVDGADTKTIFRRIMLPLMRPVILLVLILATIGTIQVFTPIYVITEGGPMRATTTIVYYLYEQGFQLFNMGYASAVAVFMSAMLFALAIIQKKAVGEKGYYY
ncbi:carbohydrate ABC transporter permease [Thermococcus paralvinellae]|uniref:Multiple sugar-binding transport inner membrane protein n=1 Tax=Thermococcus paralvinellae TaxID=582419 RepID=W0I675_9EURY|nr:sugar ABC transporter permease [Thermococcus paralvinellae]AHF79925.1 multiple sugar-binding transport inner membrane protein [Thermococcus paralvinellae]